MPKKKKLKLKIKVAKKTPPKPKKKVNGKTSYGNPGKWESDDAGSEW